MNDTTARPPSHARRDPVPRLRTARRIRTAGDVRLGRPRTAGAPHGGANAQDRLPAGTVADGAIGPRVIADYGFDDAPQLDLLLIPGGIGTFPELANEKLMAFLRDRSRTRADHRVGMHRFCAAREERRARRPSRHFEQAGLQPRRGAEQRGEVDRSRALGRRRRDGHVVRRLGRHGHGARDHRAVVRQRSRRGDRRSARNTRGIAIPPSIRSWRI